MYDLKALQQGLIDSMKAQQEAIDDATEAAILYEAELASVLNANPLLMALKTENDIAQQARMMSKTAYTEAKKNAVKELGDVSNPDDYKALDAFSYRREKDVTIVQDGLVEQLIKMGLQSLLLPNIPMISKFVSQNAIDAGDTYELPKWLLEHWNYNINVCAKINPMVMEKEIKKLAK